MGKRIMHVITDSNIGGAGRLLLAFLKEYDRSAFDVEVVLPQGSALSAYIGALGVEYTELPNMAESSFSWNGMSVLYHFIKMRQPDLVHTHASLAGRIGAKLCRCKIVHSRHYCVYPPSRRSTRFPFKQAAGFVNHFFSHAIVAVASEVKKGLIETGTRAEHIALIPNGVTPVRKLSADEKATVRGRFGIKPDDFVVTQIARLSEVKGHDYTLDTAKILAKDSSIVVLLAGDGPMEAHINQRIADEKIKNVRMAGFVSDVDEIFGITDVQINASFTEAACLSLLEGLSAGVPSVATHVGGNPQIISHGKNGLLVPVRDAQAMADAVLSLKKDTALYQKLSAEAVADYHANYHASKMTRDIESLYRSILS
ncbi:MAG: glycosyltransferase [Defluviitaleaceae bacterium]|nr:glycosyltransferase [Defluviitaleaceae bacterium]